MLGIRIWILLIDSFFRSICAAPTSNFAVAQPTRDAKQSSVSYQCFVREKAMMKAEANGPLDLVCAGEEDNKCSADACELEDFHDKKLALQLHRAVNSSPRISRSLNLSCTKSIEVMKLNDEFSAGDLSRLGYNMMETSSIKSMNVGSEDNSVNVESQSCDRKYVVVFGLKHNGNLRPECDRFGRKYSRRPSSNKS